MLTIRKDSELFTAMIFVEVSPEKQQEVFEVNVSATEWIEGLPGFVAVAFHNSLDGTMLTEYVQWENEKYFMRALDAPEFHEHLRENDRMAEHVESGPYEVRRVDVAGDDATPGTIDVSQGREVATPITRYGVEPRNLRALMGLLGEEPEHPLSGLPALSGRRSWRAAAGTAPWSTSGSPARSNCKPRGDHRRPDRTRRRQASSPGRMSASTAWTTFHPPPADRFLRRPCLTVPPAPLDLMSVYSYISAH